MLLKELTQDRQVQVLLSQDRQVLLPQGPFFSRFATALASSKAFFCASRASLVFSAIALPAATRFGFFVFVAGVCDVTCWVV